MGGEPMSNIVKVPLSTIAHGRSGDKGNMVNIGLVANKLEWYPLLKKCVTVEWLKNLFSDMVDGDIEIFLVPGIGGLNCLLKDSLQGGGTVALRKDAQGKMLGQVILQAEIELELDIMRKFGIHLPI